MGNDSFEKNSVNLFSQSSVITDNNFFLNQDKTNLTSEPIKHLNDYDSNILKEGAYKDVTDEIFKLEYKISRIEDTIRDIDNQIQAAKDIRDFNLTESLFARKKILQEDLNGLLEIYNDTSLSAKLSGSITGKFKKYIAELKKSANGISDIVISKLPGKFSSILEIKKSLAKLENINKNVDELMTMQAPFGEAGDKYEQLSKYIAKANNIQAEISKYLK